MESVKCKCMVDLTFIIPVYNVEKYLAKCLDSVLVDNGFTGQLICVNDGSTDKSGKILEEYKKQYPNVEVIIQKNFGLSAARNAGLKAATGDYICFLDSDDYWEPNVLNGLIEQIEHYNLDVLRFDFRNVNEQYEEIHPNKDPKRDVDFSESVTDGETFLNERLGPGCYAVMFIVKRSLIVKSERVNELMNEGCLFKEGIYFEDVEWTPRMLLRAKRVSSTPKVVYNYLWRAGSITLPDNPQKREKVLDDKVALIRGFKEQQKQVRDPKWFVWMTSNTAMGILTSISNLSSSERKIYIQELKDIEIFPLSTKREKMLTHKIKILLANISPSLYCTIMQVTKGVKCKV